MRTRAISSLFVILAGLLPALFGGPLFALVLIALGAAGFREFLALAARVSPIAANTESAIGYGIIAAFGLVPLIGRGDVALFVICALAVFAPLVAYAGNGSRPGEFLHWSLGSTGSLYLGLPVYSAIALRSMPGEIDAGWLVSASDALSVRWEATPLGLAWVLVVLLATWLGDTVAYMSGRAIGQRKLAPRLSPNKTVEGAIGGLIASAVVTAVCFPVFGLGPWWLGLLAGGIIGLAGQMGDLAESFLKRQAGVKDSGSLIPGHGGVLDRIDALCFAFPTGFVLAAGFEWLGIS